MKRIAHPSTLDRFGSFTRLDSIDHLDLITAKYIKRTESALHVISWKVFGKKSVLTALVPRKPVVLSVSSINIDQRVVENTSVEDQDNSSTYKINDNTNEKVNFCE